MSRQLVLEIVCLLAVLFVKESFCSALLPDTAHCGQSFENRIYGGSETHINEHPWTVLIRLRSPNGAINTCGGTLINNRYVLTAAHCVYIARLKNNTNPKPIRLGEWNRATNPDCVKLKNGKTICADPHIDVGVEEWIPQPDFIYNDQISPHDIALVRLDRSVNFTNFIQPICLPLQPQLRSKTFVDKSMDIVGWGATETTPREAALVKRKAVIKGIDSNVCRQILSKRGVAVSDLQICAGGVVGVDHCAGDSGGPLVSRESVDKRDVYVLAGIASVSGQPCGGGYPSIYTRVGSYIDWILDNLKPKDRKRKNGNEKKTNKRTKKVR